MMLATEIDEYQRNTYSSLKKTGSESSVGRLSGAATSTSKAICTFVASGVSSLQTSAVYRWAWAIAFGFVSSRCTVVVETGILAKSLVVAAGIAGRPGMTSGIAVGAVLGFLLGGTAFPQMPGFLAFFALFELLIRALNPLAAKIRSGQRGLVIAVGSVCAFTISVVLGLISGDGITALPVACATSGIVIAFGVLCGEALSMVCSVWEGEAEVSSLLDFSRSGTKYLLPLMAVFIGGLGSVAVGQVRPALVLASTMVMVAAMNYGCVIGAFMGSIAGLGLALADVRYFPMVAVYSVTGLVTGMLRGGRHWESLMLGTVAGMTVCLLLDDICRAFPLTSLIHLSIGAGLAFLIQIWFSHLLADAPSDGADGVPARDGRVHIDSARRRLQSLSGVFELLASTLSEAGEKHKACLTDGFDILLQEAHRKLCDNCGKHDACWNGRFFASYDAFLTIFAELEMEVAEGTDHAGRRRKDSRIPTYLRQHCINSTRVIPVVAEILEAKREELAALEQMQGAKEVISSQFRGIAEIVDRLVEEICTGEGPVIESGADLSEPGAARAGPGVARGKYGGALSVSRGARSDSGSARGELGGTRVESEAARSHRGRPRSVDVGIYCTARSGNSVSGDSRLIYDLGDGRTLIVLGDGMGSGETAAVESRFATTMFKELMVAGMSQRSAVEVVNSLMLIRRRDESFSTLDIAVVDTARRHVEFTKMGSCPSYIKSGRRVRRISSPSLPIGILPGLDFDTVRCAVYSGDVMLMVSDGVLGPGEDMDLIDERIIEYLGETKTTCPREIVNELADELKAMMGAVWDDDATLIAVKIP